MRLSHSNTEAETESQMIKDLQAHIHQKENPSETRQKTSNKPLDPTTPKQTKTRSMTPSSPKMRGKKEKKRLAKNLD